MQSVGAPFGERGGRLRGGIDLISGRFPAFVLGGRLNGRLLPVFHFHEVTTDDLEPKLRHLAENGYRTLVADEVAAYARGETRLDGRRVALCFDDAWASLWTVAAPLLERYGLSGITFAIPDRIADSPRLRSTVDDPAGAEAGGTPFVTWPELEALHNSGVVDVQCHTASHSMIFTSGDVVDFVTPAYGSTPLLNRPRLSPAPSLRFVTAHELGAPLYASRSRMSDGRRVSVSLDLHERCVEFVAQHGGATFFSRSDWRTRVLELTVGHTGLPCESTLEQQQAVEEELDRGRAVLNQRLRTSRVNHVCLPWGISGRSTASALARLGYRSAFANRFQGTHAVKPGDDPYWLKRLPSRYIFHLPGRGRRLWA